MSIKDVNARLNIGEVIVIVRKSLEFLVNNAHVTNLVTNENPFICNLRKLIHPVFIKKNQNIVIQNGIINNLQ